MSWQLSFINKADFTEHIRKTISQYGEQLDSYNLKKFNSNIIDPIKLIFDKTVYGLTWEEIVVNEVFRQRDKSANNSIGYFHQLIFRYIQGCSIPDEGWDVVFTDDKGIRLPDSDTVRTVFCEFKNKHNTMNSASSGKTYIAMQNQLLSDDNCACFLVEAIAKRSQNITWSLTVNKNKCSHRRIRRISMDSFYALVTGQDDAFYQMCMALPSVIEQVVNDKTSITTPDDSVIDELRDLAQLKNGSLTLAMYMLGFGTYKGFS